MPRDVAARVPQGVPDTASGTKPADDAKMQVWFQNAISTELNIPDGYLKASVLMIRWHKNLDQFPGHDEEIEKLKALFINGFNYEVEVATLNIETKPQHQLNLAITSFVNKCDGPHNLMIVYYTGHGCWYEEKKVLEFIPTNKSLEKKGDHVPIAEWNRAETPLVEDAEGDVLTILDSCYASNIQKSYTDKLRTYELLTAAGMDQPTSGPGKNSFTTVLTEELQELLNKYQGRKFATAELVQRINVNLRRRNCPSMLWDRLSRHDHHICLAPLDTLDTRDLEKRQLSFQNMQGKASLTLRIALKEERMTQTQTEKLAHWLLKAFRESLIQTQKIDWVEFRRCPQRSASLKKAVTIAQVASRFVLMGSKRDRTSTELSPTPSPTLKRSRTQESVDPPESPSAKRRISEEVSLGMISASPTEV